MNKKHNKMKFTQNLSMGSQGAEVKALQKLLKIEADGFYGVQTQEAVKQYQAQNSIEQTGTVGPITRASLNGDKPQLLPKVQVLKNQLVTIMQLIGRPVVITDEYRSIEAQNALYAQGRTKSGQIVTNAKGGESLHNYRVAFDVAFLIKGRVSYDGDWELLGGIGETLGLEWGGRWSSFVDKPHFQLLLGYSLKDFQQGRVDFNKYNI